MADALLEIWTARLDYRGTDRADMRVGTTDPIGKLFEPPMELAYCGSRVRSDRAWEDLVARYTDRARASYRVRREEWLALRHRASVTLVCGCAKPQECLTRIAAELLARALPGLSVLRGERRTQGALRLGAAAPTAGRAAR